MIYKRCIRCGKRIPSGTVCECQIKDKRTYAKPTGIKKEYHTNKWKMYRDYIMNKYDHLDLYALYHYGKAKQADTVHHIEETKDNPNMFYSESNLIPVSRDSHAEIHKRYRDKDINIKKELKSYLMRYKKTGGM